MLLYRTLLTPLVELLQNEYTYVLQPWYADDAAFISPAKRNAQLLNQITNMDLILVITQNQQSHGISAHHQNMQMLKYILQKKDSTSNSLKDIVMLEVSLDPT